MDDAVTANHAIAHFSQPFAEHRALCAIAALAKIEAFNAIGYVEQLVHANLLGTKFLSPGRHEVSEYRAFGISFFVELFEIPEKIWNAGNVKDAAKYGGPSFIGSK